MEGVGSESHANELAQATFDDEKTLHYPSLPGISVLAETPSAFLPEESAFDLPRLMTELAGVAEAIGARNFYSVALATLGRLLGCERQVAVRYAQFAKPQFLVNYSLSTEAEDIYMRELYRIDPLLHLVRTQVPDRVMTALHMPVWLVTLLLVLMIRPHGLLGKGQSEAAG